MKNKNGGRVALCGMTAALATLAMLLTVVPVSEIGLPAVAGLLLVPTVVELGRRYALSVYVTVCLLSLLLVPAWEPKLLFIGFFGYYPIVKSLIEALRKPVAEWVIKFALFNGTVVGIYWVLLTFLHLDTAAFTIAGKTVYGLLLLLGNGVFLLYDIGLTRVISHYVAVFSPRLRRLFRF
ncbi:MAG: hypothetical protein IJO76_02970 [Clostridia bacterium]|nr:hypothetical protein [Clostridia bacterium]